MINFDPRTGMIFGIVVPFYHPETLNIFGGFFTNKTRFAIDFTNGGNNIYFQPNNIFVGTIARFDVVVKGLEVVAYLDKTQVFYSQLASVLQANPENFVFGSTSPQQGIRVDTIKKQILNYPVMGVYLTAAPRSAPISVSSI